MAQALTLTLDKDLPDALAAYRKAGPGKALARESDKLDMQAKRKGAAAPTALLSESQAVLIQQMKDQGFDPSKMRLPPEQWYAPADGLKTVRVLIEHVSANLNEFKQPNPILRDLRAAETLLAAAEAAGAKFHFTRAEV